MKKNGEISFTRKAPKYWYTALHLCCLPNPGSAAVALYTISYFQICNLSDLLFNLLCKLTGLNCQSRAFQSRASSELWRVKGKYNILHSNIKRSIIYNKLEMVKQTFCLNIAFHGQVMTILQKRFPC